MIFILIIGAISIVYITINQKKNPQYIENLNSHNNKDENQIEKESADIEVEQDDEVIPEDTEPEEEVNPAETKPVDPKPDKPVEEKPVVSQPITTYGDVLCEILYAGVESIYSDEHYQDDPSLHKREVFGVDGEKCTQDVTVTQDDKVFQLKRSSLVKHRP